MRPLKINCGSGLARECGVSVNTSVTDPPHSRASPLPQGISVQHQNFTEPTCHDRRHHQTPRQRPGPGVRYPRFSQGDRPAPAPE
ncbi:hypothetical protein DBR46_14415 [Pseudomonas sp. KBW05]|nr:hypothetical protein DBR46_14415 [Pseudomonas sp. KBW05]